MTPSSPAVEALRLRLQELGWVTDLWVAGSLATGDYVPGVSDLDLVARVDGPVTPSRRATIADLHAQLDAGEAEGTDLGCQYVEADLLLDLAATHPTWTHGSMVDCILFGITRVELVRHGPHLDGPWTSRPGDRPAADQERCGRAGRRGWWSS